MRRLFSHFAGPSALATGAILSASCRAAKMDDDSQLHLACQPTFQAINIKKRFNSNEEQDASRDSLLLISGTAHKELSNEISSLIGKELAGASIKRFSDGEVSIQINDSIRGKNVFIIQPCASPVNDNIMELLLTISAAKRSGAHRVTAVIPYFGYKHHRRSMSTSTRHQSKFLASGAMDVAKMLQEMGVDHVVSVDVQRPGQGHEACLLDNNIPLEVIVTTDLMIEHFVKNIKLENPIVVVSPNAECVKKARKFQFGFRKGYNRDVKLAAFFHSTTGSGPTDLDKLELLLGKAQIAGSDVVIVDDMVDSAETLTVIAQRLHLAGAANIYACASHGLFSKDAVKLIDEGYVKQVVVTNSLPLPQGQHSPKIYQLSVAELLAKIILSEHFRTKLNDDDEHLEMD